MSLTPTAFLFPGQGSQAVGMGRALAEQYPEARQVFEAADDALGFSLSKLCFEGPEEELRLTTHTQPAILATSLAAHAVLSRRTEVPQLVAGHSLGELSALCAVGAFPLSDALRVVRERGRLMQEAVAPGVGAMAAILGLDPDRVSQACDEVRQAGEVVQPANYNEPAQTVISGHAAAVARAGERCLALGAKRAVPLPVSAPFHCALMAPVQGPLGQVLRRIAWRPPVAPVVSNVEAAPNADPARFAELLVTQVVAPVKWVGCVQALARAGVRRVVEVGTGRVLGGLVRRIDKNLAVFNVEDPASLEKALAGLAEGA